MHIIHGNPAGYFTLHVGKMNGLQKDGRWEFITEHLVDYMAITETHATAYVQKTLDKKISGTEHGIIWGHPLDDRNFSGAGFVYKKSSSWIVRAVPFLEPECDRYFKDGRLLAVQLFRSDEKRSFIIYVLYGISGARWEIPKREYVQKLIAAIHRDSVQRGGLATVICGDFNLEVSDFTVQYEQLRTDHWVDAAYFGTNGFCNDNTSYKGKGSRIDLAFVNTCAAGALQSYSVQEGVIKNDHGMLQLVFHGPLASQTWKMPRQGEKPISYNKPPADFVPERIFPDTDLHIALRMGNMDKAYLLWCRRAERLLRQIPREDGTYTEQCHRGNTSVRKLCKFPPEQAATMVDVWSRKLARALRRVEALQCMQQWHHRAQQTFTHVRQFFNNEQRHFITPSRTFGDDSLGQAVLKEMETLLRTEYRAWHAKVRSIRLRNWKDRVQSSVKASYKWIRGQQKVEMAPMTLADGTSTVEINKQLDAFYHEWSPILEKYKNGEPDEATFMQHFGPYMSSSTMQLEMLTGEQLVQAARKTTPSSASLDRWTPAALTALSQWYPEIYNDLAAILNQVESGSPWPSSMLEGYTSLIPKSETLKNPRPTDYRPITVLSAIYRLWSKARFGVLLQWQEQWVPSSVFGCRPKLSAEGLAMQIALGVEDPAYTVVIVKLPSVCPMISRRLSIYYLRI